MERHSSGQDMTAMVVGFGLVIATSVFFLLKGPSKSVKEDVAANTAGSTVTASPLQTMSVVEVRGILAKSISSILVVDLRSAGEFKSSHAAGSVSASSVADFGALPVPDGGTVLLISSGDAETDRRASDVAKAGGKKFAFIADGLSGWQSAGGAVVTEPSLTSPIDRSKVTFVKTDAWKEMFAQKDIVYRILDVRSTEDASRSPVPGSLGIPFTDLEKQRSEIPYASNIALCASNAEDAYRAAVRLFDLGFFSVMALDGACPDIVTK
ncbi:MAG: rhodanese-like domain-containing protein [Candidatus Moranbacteria bacterium]|nr:rhodanese-like domain-containing protein [Candidatus Moranbacteria bacterium]